MASVSISRNYQKEITNAKRPIIIITKRSDMSSIHVEINDADPRIYADVDDFVNDYTTETFSLYDEKKTKFLLMLDKNNSTWYRVKDGYNEMLSGMHEMTRSERNAVTSVIENYPDLAQYLSI